MLRRRELDTGWRGRLERGGPEAPSPALGDFAAAVPGAVHLDLLSAGLIPDPYDGENEHELRWVGDSDWSYRTVFAHQGEGDDRTELVFDGLDTVATVLLNGREIARAENMHRVYRVPAEGIREGDNELEVRFRSPRAFATERRDALGARPTAYSDLPPFIRKAACDFGWDWGPDLAGAGIWKPVHLESWSTARIASARPVVRVDGATGHVRLEVEVERARAGVELSATARVAGVEARLTIPAGEKAASVELEIPDAERWWPHGLGPQTLHTLHLELVGPDGVLDERAMRIGFREVVVEQQPDEQGSGFRILVNGEPLFVRGLNWIPDDSFQAGVGRERYRERIGQAVELGANLIRVWGGGTFAVDDFYEECDEQGVLVWQDFLFACAAYPEEEPYASEIEAEARDNITRIMPHPSLALWNGNNENIWFWFLHDWKTVLEGKSWGEAYYFELLPRLVAELDPERFYLAGSPYSGARDLEPNDPSRGVIHCWIPGDYREYTAFEPRFVSEFGFQGPPSRALFDAVTHEEDPAPFSPATVQRQKAAYGTERIEDVMRVHLGIPSDFDEWYWLAQLNQARAVGFGVDWFRSQSPRCAGTVLWQLNDCWPVISWSVIDHAARWKPAAYALRRAFADRVAVVHVTDGTARVSFGNESRERWEADAVVEVRTASSVRERRTVRVAVEPHDTGWVELGSVAEDELVVVTVDGIRATALGSVDLAFADAEPQVEVSIEPHASGVSVTLTAATLLREACLLPDSVDENAHCDVNLLTLLPGESATWTIATAHPERFDEGAVHGMLRLAHAARTRVET